MSYFNYPGGDYYSYQERKRTRIIIITAVFTIVVIICAAFAALYFTGGLAVLTQGGALPDQSAAQGAPANSALPPNTGGGIAMTQPSGTNQPPQQTAAQTPVNPSGKSVAQILAGDDNPVVRIAEEVGGAIVGVSNKMSWYSRRDGSIELVEQGAGSGIIISESGYIVTNYHVIENAEAISVFLPGGIELDADIVGFDERTDIAVLKIEPYSGMKIAPLGVSADIKAGQLAVAIGNPLGRELAGTVTLGCISAVDRVLTLSDGRTVTLIQTDAAISSGNSGGALLNIDGEVIGINTLKASQSSASDTTIEGLGFAIPIDVAKPVIDELIATGVVTRPGLGISGTDFTAYYAAQFDGQYPVGLYVADTVEGSGAREAGLAEGDIITHLNGERIYTYDEMKRKLTAFNVGDYVSITYFRENAEHTVDVRLIGITS